MAVSALSRWTCLAVCGGDLVWTSCQTHSRVYTKYSRCLDKSKAITVLFSAPCTLIHPEYMMQEMHHRHPRSAVDTRRSLVVFLPIDPPPRFPFGPINGARDHSRNINWNYAPRIHLVRIINGTGDNAFSVSKPAWRWLVEEPLSGTGWTRFIVERCCAAMARSYGVPPPHWWWWWW